MKKFDPDAPSLAFIATHNYQSGAIMGATQQTAINNRYKRYMGILPNPNGSVLWPLIKGTNARQLIMCPVDNSTANINAFKVDFVSQTAIGTFNSFAPGDINVTGLKGGNSKYFASSLAPSDYPQDNVGHFAYIRTQPSLACSIMGANDVGNANRTALITDLASGFRSYINNTTVSTDAVVTPIRFIGTQRGNSTTLESIKDGVVVKTEALTSTSRSTRPFYWWARSNNGLLNNEFVNGEISMISQGFPYLTANQLADMYWIEQLYQTEIITGGRQV